MLGLLITIIVGAAAGWVASKIMARDAEQGALGNIVVGIVGAMIGNALLDAFESSARSRWGELSLESFLVALLGAVILLAIINLFTRKRVR